MCIRGSKLYEAASFLVNTLSGIEMLSNEVYQLAAQAGIADRTLKYAKYALGVKSRKIGGSGWAMSLPGNAREYLSEIGYPPPAPNPMRLREKGAISSDFVCVSSMDSHSFELPFRPTSVRLRVKVGSVEFEVDEGFPAEKLIAPLRGLEADAEC